MTNIQNVPCPYCGKTLYRIGPLDKDRGVWGKLPDGPKMENDEKGNFMSCPECLRRVDMEITSSPTGAGFRPKAN